MNTEITDTMETELKSLIETFAPLIDQEFDGLGNPGRDLTDAEYPVWFEMQLDTRPNFVQALMMPGVEGGRGEVLRYIKLTGGGRRIVPILYRMYTEQGDMGAVRMLNKAGEVNANA